jgi:VWFA-related protein
VRNKAAAFSKNGTVRAIGMAVVLIAGWLGGYLGAGAVELAAQSSGSAPQTQTKPAQDTDIPDAPSVQPDTTPPAPPPIPKPEEKKPAPALNPWTNQPESKPAAPVPDAATGDATSTAPPMPPVRTVPPGTTTKSPNSQEQLYTLVVHSNFVQIPVTVKDHDGRMVDGLLPNDFVVKDNEVVQKLSFFSADPFALSVAVVLDLGMPDMAVQKVNQTFGALMGAFAPYDEVAFYTYSSTVSQVSDFTGATGKLAALLNQMKTERGHNNGPAVLNGPLANGPVVNGIPVGSPTAPVYTPPKEAHVLNDAVLQAALDLRKRGRERRKIILIISDGRESGSSASYKDVLRVLLSNEIQVKAVAVDSAALPVYSKLERLRLPHEGYDDILPKYVSATGGGQVDKELSQSAIENIYAEAMSEARNQYTLGYYLARPKVPTSGARHNVEVVVLRKGLKIYAKDYYYPAVAR